MLINEIKFKLKDKKRIGRGGKRGNYSGRGMKGQKARAGRRIRPAERDLIIRIPKLRGFKFKGLKHIKKNNIFLINLETINKQFNENESVDFQSLLEKKLIKIPKSKKNFKIKILGKGDLNKKLYFSNKFIFSQQALVKIKNSGSEIIND